jgi:hypothetical protein
LRLLQTPSTSSISRACFSRPCRPFSSSTAAAHVETAGDAHQEPADRAVASAKKHLKVISEQPQCFAAGSWPQNPFGQFACTSCFWTSRNDHSLQEGGDRKQQRQAHGHLSTAASNGPPWLC